MVDFPPAQSVTPSGEVSSGTLAADTAMPSAPILDRDTLTILESVLPFSNIESLITLFLSEADGHLTRIRAAQSEANLNALAPEAHSMVSSAGNVGAMALSDLARTLEHACKQNQPASAERLVFELSKACSAATIASKEWLNERRCADVQTRDASSTVAREHCRVAV